MAKMSFTIDLNEKNDIEQVINTLQLLTISAEQRTVGADEAHELLQQQESAYDLMQNAQAEQQPVVPPAPSQEQQQPVAPPAPSQEQQQPVAPPAPSQEQQQPVAPPAPSQDVDSSGLPWDERIHGKQKNKNKDGTWRKKKGVDKELVAQVEAELRGEAAPPAPSQEQQQPVAPAPPAPPAPSQEQQQPVAPAPPAPSQEQDDWPESTAFPANDFPTTFPDFMVMLTERGITAEQIGPVLDKFGIPSIGALAARVDLIPTISAEVFK